jgi:pimeloyl-ACP methyl ester carboxylesterase
MPYMDLDDVELYYTEHGSGAPVLLVHGMTCDVQDWIWQIPVLAQAHRVIAVDLRGHGRSSVPEGGYTPRGFARDLDAFLDRLDVGPVVAVGHSLGGLVVSTLAVEYPDRLRAVIPIDAPYGLSTSSGNRASDSVDRIAHGSSADVVIKLFEGFYTPSSPPYLRVLHEQRIRGMSPVVIGKTALGLYADPQILTLPDCEGYYQDRRCPVLSVGVREREWEDRLVAKDPLSATVFFEGAGHWLHQEQPERFNDLMLEWLAKIPLP